MASFIESLAMISMPNMGQNGKLIMLACYLDDSGTHDQSRVIVWAGLAGHIQHFKEFEKKWKRQLRDPCDGLKPQIKALHSSYLALGDGEFAGYSEAERDLTRKNFRQIIIDCELTWVSYGISKEAWDNAVKEKKIYSRLTAESIVFGKVISTLCKSSLPDEPMSFQFDKGRQPESIVRMIEPAIGDAKKEYVSYAFTPVALNVGLQGADLVAHETYRFFNKYMDDQGATPIPHLQRLVDGAHDSLAGWFGRDEIDRAIVNVDSSFTGYERDEYLSYLESLDSAEE